MNHRKDAERYVARRRGGESHPYWVYDTQNDEDVIGFRSIHDAIDQAKQWNAGEDQAFLNHVRKPKLCLIHGGNRA